MADRTSANLAHLGRWVPTLPDLLARESGELAPERETARSGAPSARMRREDGTEVWLHSRNDPEREAARWAEGLPAAPLATYVLLGVGLGYPLAALLRRIPPGTPVVAVERSPALARQALARVDFTAPADRPIFFLPGIAPEEIFPLLRSHNEMLLAGPVLFAEHPASVQGFPRYYDPMRTAVTRWVQAGAMGLQTGMALGERFTGNRVRNLEAYLDSPGIRPWQGCAAGFPVIVVSAGPSLRKNIHRLAEAQEGAVVIAVSTALKAVLGAGVRPDFTVLIDYHEVSRRYFEDIPAGRPIPMVTEACAAPAAVSAHQGPRLFAEDRFYSLLMPSLEDRYGWLPKGSTVAHTAAEFALYLGAERVVLVGQDLSYSHGITHVPGTAIHAEWLPRTNRFATLETLEWESLIAAREQKVRVADRAGKPLYTDQSMLTYLKEFEAMAARHPGRFVNATEGGARIAGMEDLDLAEALRRHARPRRPDPLVEVRGARPAGERDAARRELAVALADLRGLMDGLGRLHVAIEQVGEALAAGRDADPFVHQVRAADDALRGGDRLQPILSAMGRSAEWQRERAMREIAAAAPTGRDLQAAQVARDLEFVGARRDTCRVLIDLLEAVAR